MSITTDQPVLDLDEEDRPTQLAQPPRDNQPEHRRTRKHPLPARIIWVTAVVALATAGIAAAVGLNEDDTSTPANRASGGAQVGEPTHGEIGPTEIDVHGIPTWWSGEPPAPHPPIGSTAPTAIGPTELDVHGIPTWWSGEPAAPHPPIGSTAPTAIGPTELDVHGIPTWWSGEPAAPHPPIGSTAPTAIGPTELDVHGIPTWWSGEPAAVDPLEP